MSASFGTLSVPYTGKFSQKSRSAGGSGPPPTGALLAVNNLSDVQSLSNSVANLGLANGYVNFNTNVNQVLMAPMPRKIDLNMTLAGLSVQLPDATTLSPNTIGDAFFIQNFGTASVEILDGTGDSLQVIFPGTTWEYWPEDNTTVAGFWKFSSSATQIFTEMGGLNADYYPLYVASNGSNITQTPLVTGNYTINPVTGLAKVPQLMVGPSFTPVPCNVKLFVNGADSSTTDGPGMGFFTAADSYPVMQILPFSHTLSAIYFNCYSYNSNAISSSTTANFAIQQVGTQLQFLYSSGNAQGRGFGFGQAGYFDTSGNLTLTNLRQGSVPFAGNSGIISQDNTNFSWDNTAKTLTVNAIKVLTLSPSSILATDLLGNIISSSASLPNFVAVSATTQQMAMNTTYIITGTSPVIFTLPPTNSGIGEMRIIGYGNATWTVQTNAGQTIIDNGISTTVSAQSTTAYDSATFVYAGNNSGIFQIAYQNGMQITLN